MIAPEALLPEAKALHRLVRVAERRVGVRCALQVHVDQLLEVASNNLCVEGGRRNAANTVGWMDD